MRPAAAQLRPMPQQVPTCPPSSASGCGHPQRRIEASSRFFIAGEMGTMEEGGPPSQCRGLSPKSHRYRLPPVNGGCIVCPPHAERSYAASRLIGLAAALAVMRPAQAFSAAPAPVRAFATASAPVRIAYRAQSCVDAPRRRPRRTHLFSSNKQYHFFVRDHSNNIIF